MDPISRLLCQSASEMTCRLDLHHDLAVTNSSAIALCAQHVVVPAISRTVCCYNIWLRIRVSVRITVRFSFSGANLGNAWWCGWGRWLSVHDNFSTYTFGTCFFGTASFSTLSVNIGTVSFGTYSILVQSTLVQLSTQLNSVSFNGRRCRHLCPYLYNVTV